MDANVGQFQAALKCWASAFSGEKDLEVKVSLCATCCREAIYRVTRGKNEANQIREHKARE